MNRKITKFTPHQNGKVFGILVALGSLIFLVPMFLIFSMVTPQPNSPPAFIFLLFPIMYLIFGYLSIAAGCLMYNFMFRYIGGIEYDAEESGT